MSKKKEQTNEFELSVAELVLRVEQFLAEENDAASIILFEDLLPFDMYTLFKGLTYEQQEKILNILPDTDIAEIFAHFEPEDAAEYFKKLQTERVAEILNEMSSDDSVEILREFDRADVSNYLSNMEEDVATEIRELLFYDDESAGSIMAFGMITVLETDTVRRAMKKIVDNAPDAETITVIYVLDSEEVLVGVMSLREMIIARSQEIVKDVMSERVIKIAIGQDREVAAQLMMDYDLTVLPVVNDSEHLEGIITIDDVVDIVREEAEEDYLKLAGVTESATGKEDDYKIMPSLKKRLPWLISMVFLSIFVSTAISAFQEGFEPQIIVLLTPFITMVNNMTGVPGIQVAAIAMLKVVSGDFVQNKKLLQKFISNQVITAMIIGGIIGIVVGLCALGLTILFGQINIMIFFIVGLSVFFSSLISSCIGIFSVLFLDKIGKDPAVASGPFMSTIGDMIGVTTYFLIAFIMYYLF
ncbi:magnesium transporter MgtE [Erysipelotrichaceae bacterium]|nr:magnesium transporter MgtE [Erysipelotrichaceae bacterium]